MEVYVAALLQGQTHSDFLSLPLTLPPSLAWGDTVP